MREGVRVHGYGSLLGEDLVRLVVEVCRGWPERGAGKGGRGGAAGGEGERQDEGRGHVAQM
jgi:hypothetical protein